MTDVLFSVLVGIEGANTAALRVKAEMQNPDYRPAIARGMMQIFRPASCQAPPIFLGRKFKIFSLVVCDIAGANNAPGLPPVVQHRCGLCRVPYRMRSR